MSRRHIAAAAVLALTLLGTASGCGDEPEGTATDESTTSSSATSSASEGTSPSPDATDTDSGVGIAITIADGEVTPNGERVQVKVGEPITLEITSDTDEELHVHSSPEHEFEIGPGSTKETFTIDRPGIVEVEMHHLGVTVLQLEVS